MSDGDDDQAKRYGDLKTEIKDAGGVLTVSMGRLRDVHGAGKLGNIVVESIAEQLKSVGLGHAPQELPTSQWKQVLVYQIGTPSARLISAIYAIDEESAETIRKFANAANNTDTATIRKIRELVCD